MELFGIRLVGINAENGQKLLMTFLLIGAVLIVKSLIAKGLRYLYRKDENMKLRFWTRQALNLTSALVILLTFLSIWFDDPTRLATGLGLVTAGLAFALQKVVTSFAGYLVIMRGKTFSVGERITIGGVRGDVITLGFLQTTIMEMGQPSSVQGADPAMWIKGRQYTGRIVTVTNDKIFDQPVFNYTREFPFIWEEINIPIKYDADRKAVEEIMMKVVQKHTDKPEEMSKPLRENLERKYGIQISDMVPKVFYRLTDNWLELSARFIVPEHGVRFVKDAISRDIIEEMDKINVEIASATFDIVGLPTINLKIDQDTVRKLTQPDQPGQQHLS